MTCLADNAGNGRKLKETAAFFQSEEDSIVSMPLEVNTKGQNKELLKMFPRLYHRKIKDKSCYI